MDMNQVVYEYGLLHLNLVAAQRQNAQLAQQLASLNKNGAALAKDRVKALDRVAQLEAWIKEQGLALEMPNVPDDPEPQPQTEAAGPGQPAQAKPILMANTADRAQMPPQKPVDSN